MTHLFLVGFFFCRSASLNQSSFFNFVNWKACTRLAHSPSAPRIRYVGTYYNTALATGRFCWFHADLSLHLNGKRRGCLRHHYETLFEKRALTEEGTRLRRRASLCIGRVASHRVGGASKERCVKRKLAFNFPKRIKILRRAVPFRCVTILHVAAHPDEITTACSLLWSVCRFFFLLFWKNRGAERHSANVDISANFTPRAVTSHERQPFYIPQFARRRSARSSSLFALGCFELSEQGILNKSGCLQKADAMF